MAKKTAHTRSAAQRNRPKTTKSIELVRQTPTEKEVVSEGGLEEESNGVAISTATTATSETEKENTKSVSSVATTAKTSASARRCSSSSITENSAFNCNAYYCRTLSL